MLQCNAVGRITKFLYKTDNKPRANVFLIREPIAGLAENESTVLIIRNAAALEFCARCDNDNFTLGVEGFDLLSKFLLLGRS